MLAKSCSLFTYYQKGPVGGPGTLLTGGGLLIRGGDYNIKLTTKNHNEHNIQAVLRLFNNRDTKRLIIVIHPVSVRRFPSFRTQPLEHLRPLPMKQTYLSNPAPGENLLSGNLVMETGCKHLITKPLIEEI